MYARSTTIQAQPLSVDIGIAHVRDVVMPALQEIDGFVGLSLLVDRQSGTCIATSAWDGLEKRCAPAPSGYAPVRDRAAMMFEGSARIEEWEIALLHRRPPVARGGVRAGHLAQGACRSSSTARLDFYRTAVLPEMEKFDGFCSASLMVDPPGCVRWLRSTYDSVDAMERPRPRGRAAEPMLRDLGVEEDDVVEFELAIAHLRVPELV